jgi:oligopeptide/dipeptide ABC transporter ATP-binding protein
MTSTFTTNKGSETSTQEPLIAIKDLKKHFPITGGVLARKVGNVYAVDGVSFEVQQGETIGLVGESGCGKSTLGKTLLQLYTPTAGRVLWNTNMKEVTGGEQKVVDLAKVNHKQMKLLRKDFQMIFQDPMDSLNARMSVGTILSEPFIIHQGEHPFDTPEKRKKEILSLLKSVGLPESAYHRYPHEFSGGQRQRIGIARAIALRPKLVVCDEPVSALDVSVQSQILNLMVKLQKERNLTFIFIAHNLSVVKYIADRICVMYLGKIVETASAEDLYKNPLHPYTQALISAIPEPDPTLSKEKQLLEGDVPSPINPPLGCHFHTRCPYAQPKCQAVVPSLRGHHQSDSHKASCHFVGKLKPRSI